MGRRRAGGPVDAVIVLGDMAGATLRKPWVVPWSTASGRRRSACSARSRARCGAEGGRAGGTRAIGQWVRRALPFDGLRAGRDRRAGLPAVLLQRSGERGPSRDEHVRRRTGWTRSAARRCGRSARSTPRSDREADEPAFAGEP